MSLDMQERPWLRFLEVQTYLNSCPAALPQAQILRNSLMDFCQTSSCQSEDSRLHACLLFEPTRTARGRGSCRAAVPLALAWPPRKLLPPTQTAHPDCH